MVFVWKRARIDVHTRPLHTSNAQVFVFFFHVDALCRTVRQVYDMCIAAERPTDTGIMLRRRDLKRGSEFARENGDKTAATVWKQGGRNTTEAAAAAAFP